MRDPYSCLTKRCISEGFENVKIMNAGNTESSKYFHMMTKEC